MLRKSLEKKFKRSIFVLKICKVTLKVHSKVSDNF